MSKEIIVIGAGPGGLASAILLAVAGARVKILERLPIIGGRTSTIESGGFKFDLGPTFFRQVLPFVLLAMASSLEGSPLILAGAGITLAYLPRFIGVLRFGQSVGTSLLHPLGVLTLLAIQWYALVKSALGRPSQWKGRSYSPRNPFGKAAAVASRAGCLIAFAWLAAVSAEAQLATNRTCPPFELRDQFQTLHRIEFPRTNVMVLTIADKHGNQQLRSWIEPLNEHQSPRCEIIGIAVLNGVPRFLREGIREKFVKTLEHPVMLDWEGRVTSRFQLVKHQANIYVLDGCGAVRAHFAGPAKPESLQRLIAVIETAIRQLP